MSTAGIYNYRPKVAHPNEIFIQMTSDGLQKPFYFGGSQVPINLNLPPEGSGLMKQYTYTSDKQNNLSMKGRGIEVTTSKYNKICMPKNFKQK